MYTRGTTRMVRTRGNHQWGESIMSWLWFGAEKWSKGERERESSTEQKERNSSSLNRGGEGESRECMVARCISGMGFTGLKVWCGVVERAMAWCGMVGCELVGCELVGCEMVGCEMVGCELVRRNMVGCRLVWCVNVMMSMSLFDAMVWTWWCGFHEVGHMA
jgi:hypothetical protein